VPIQWTKDLSLGIPKLDAQHLELDRHLGLIHDAVCEGRAPDLSSVLDGIRGCMSQHFASEEAFMARCRYPALEGHRVRHRDFLDQLARFEDAFGREGATTRLALEVGNWLAAWVREHQRYDLHVAAYARKAGLLETGGTA